MGIKIHQYPNEATIVNGNDLYDIDAYISAGVYESKKIKAITLSEGISALKPYGAFYDTTTQTVTSGSTAAMKFNTTDFSQHIEVGNDGLGNPTIIQVQKGGIYNLQFSAQINRVSGGSSANIVVWFRVNGIDLPNSATKKTTESNHGKDVLAWNIFLNLSANDEVQVMWTQNDAIELLYEAASTYPAIPSVIATINLV